MLAAIAASYRVAVVRGSVGAVTLIGPRLFQDGGKPIMHIHDSERAFMIVSGIEQ